MWKNDVFIKILLKHFTYICKGCYLDCIKFSKFTVIGKISVVVPFFLSIKYILKKLQNTVWMGTCMFGRKKVFHKIFLAKTHI